MFMTNLSSIQDVLFFPQMKPEKQQFTPTGEEFEKIGVPKDWVPLLLKLEIKTLDDLKTTAEAKLFNDLNGLRKKMKLSMPTLQLSELQTWKNNI
jgi:lysyl-tRNA synthetase class 2